MTMERTPRSSKTEYDVTQPVQAELDETCFGREYSPRTVHCQKCHDSTLCLIKFNEAVKSKVKSVESEHRMLDTERVPPVEEEWGKKLALLAQDYFDKGNPLTRAEVGDALTEEYAIQDDVTKQWWINRWITNYGVSHLIKE